MTITDLPLQGLKLIELKLFRDERGYFTEWYQEARFAGAGLPNKFIQDNYSRSKPGVIRGLHYQTNPTQGKLVGVLNGRILDVAVDIRSDSPTYGKWFGVELSDSNGKLLWIPPGFAHGFCVLGKEEASVMYKVDGAYSPSGEGGIRFDDPDFKINWPTENSLIVSDRDRALQGFSQYSKNPVFKT